MLPDRLSNPGPLTFESGALPIALRIPADQLHGISELQISGVLKIIQRFFFIFLNENICCDPPLEPSHQDGSNDGSQNMLLW